MIQVRAANQRGQANFGWLDTRYSFSFANYYDPDQMGVSDLRVLNDDMVAPQCGFPMHGHRDMEIITYVLEGTVQHKDSEGNQYLVSAGQFQLMSAGSGILHSEMNPSADQPLHLLQIWIKPRYQGEEPSYQQHSFVRQEGLTLIASPDDAAESFTILQDARLYRLLLAPKKSLHFQPAEGRCCYLHLIRGSLRLNGEKLLSTGDGAQISKCSELHLENAGGEEIEALLFDLR